jgi:four helix bundle protein
VGARSDARRGVETPHRSVTPTERSGLADQWRRAASSVVLNIAEGASRAGNKEFRKHLGIARASLDEIEAIVDLAVGLDYLRREDVSKVSAVRDECARTVYGLMRKLGENGR